MSRGLSLGLWGVALFLSSVTPRTASAAPPRESIHASQSALHARGPSVLATRARQPSPRALAAAPGRIVFGYYPHWASPQAQIPWAELTHLAYFSVEVNANGTLGEQYAWDTAAGAALVAEGHAHGASVVLTATLFDELQIKSLLNDPTRRATLVAALADAMGNAGADGISIDFEYVPATANAGFVALFAELRDALDARLLRPAHLSVALPATLDLDAYDVAGISEHADALLVMTYDYHWRSSPPGPVAPLSAGAKWDSIDVQDTLAAYLAAVGTAKAHKVVLGLPLYGYDWPTQSVIVPGTARGSADSKTVETCDAVFAVQKSWDEVSSTPYRAYSGASSGAHQLFCEDGDSYDAKLALALDLGLGGAMLWAVTYAPADHAVWTALLARFPRAERASWDGPTPVDPTPDDPSDPGPDSGGSAGADDGGCAATRGFGLMGGVAFVLARVVSKRRAARSGMR